MLSRMSVFQSSGAILSQATVGHSTLSSEPRSMLAILRRQINSTRYDSSMKWYPSSYRHYPLPSHLSIAGVISHHDTNDARDPGVVNASL